MTHRQIEELLSQQADRLAVGREQAGQERAAELTSVERAGLTQEEQRTLGGLMRLARRVQASLVETEPRPAFAADLKARLVAQRRAAAQPEGQGGHGGILWVLGVAGALSLAGLGFLGYRVVASRGARPALPKA